MIADGNLMKQLNLNKVRWIMKNRGELSKPEIARETGLSVVTVNSLVRALVESGELLAAEGVAGANGRPAMRYRFNEEYSRGIALCLREGEGKQVILAAVVNRSGRQIARDRFCFETVGPGEIRMVMNGLLESYDNIKAASIGLPGPVKDNRVILGRDFPALQEGDLAAELSAEFGIPVILENDVNAAILGYSRRTVLTDEACVAGLYFPERFCMGCGIYLMGQIWRGKRAMAGELFGLPVNRRPKGGLSPQEFLDCIGENMRILTAVLDPEQIVVYCEGRTAMPG